MNEAEKRILDSISEAEVVSFLQAIIRAKSPHPPGDTREVAEVCRQKLAEAGIATELVCPDPDYPTPWDYNPPVDHIPSVIGTIPGGDGAPVLLFNAHIDTVPVGDLENWRHDPYSGVIEDDEYVYGRGAGDDKGSVAAQVMAAVAIARSGVKLGGTLVVNPVADEEACSYRGTQYLRDAGYLKPTYLVIGEQTDNEVAVAERGVLWMEVTITGKAAHGAIPGAGNNAIVRATEFIHLVATEYAESLAGRKNEYLPHPTASVTQIRGGIKDNIIPEHCTITIDRRLIPGETVDMAVEEIRSLLRKTAENHAFEWEVKVTYDAGPPVNTSADSQLVQTMRGAAEEISGRRQRLTGYRQGSDGRLFSHLDIPIAIYGPSDPEVGHAANERVSIAQMVESTKVYALTALRVLGVESD